VRTAEVLDRRGVRFNSVGGDTAFHLCPVPRVIAADEWAVLESGLGQRVRALNAFLADAYGSREIVAAGVIPEAAIDDSEGYEPSLRGHEAPGGVWVGIAGLDLVRGSDGRFLVLEDNLTTPSGMAYAVAARRVLTEELGDDLAGLEPLDGLAGMLGRALRSAAPEGAGDDPALVVLTDGP
jgi:uncharacterized circularly permuted ATP-grasp superfamily protein